MYVGDACLLDLDIHVGDVKAVLADQDYNRRILTHPSAEDLKEKLATNLKKVKNPYKDAYIWLKGEFLDVSGMYDSLQGREGVMKS